MAAWRTLGSLVVALAAAPTLQAQTCDLTEAPLPGSHFHIKLSMTLTGELKVQQEGKTLALKESATATHEYVERILEAGADGTAGKAARFYKQAKVQITVANDRLERGLRPERCLMVAQRAGERLLTYCPKGPLTRDELDVTEHLDTLAVTGLLPGRVVKVGETWKPANPVVQALCHFDGLTANELECKLAEVKDGVATVEIGGTAGGIDLGATVKLKVRGSCRFDLKARRLAALEWKQTDEREQGPVSPAAAVEITTTLTRTPVEGAAEVNDFALVHVPSGPALPEGMTLLAYADPKGRYELLHAREWRLVGQTDEHLVLRLLDKGEFVAQVSVSPWKKMAPGKHLSGDEFKETIAGTPGWVQEKLLEAVEVPSENGNWIYRVAAEGQLDGLKALQYFYLVAGPQGDQLVLAFTMTPAQAPRLGSRDLLLLRSITFPRPQGEEKK
jgi:hypothetical protein